MIISDDEYKEVLAYCQRLLQNMALPNTAECLKLGVSTDAALCIYQQLYTRRVKKLSGLVENDISNIAQVIRYININLYIDGNLLNREFQLVRRCLI